MNESILYAVTLIGMAGIGAQWLAWRINAPAIVLMSIAGLLLGPVFGLLDPRETFGDVYDPLISIAVGIILFEGGLQLKFEELRDVGSGVRRLVVPGALIAWALGTVAGTQIAGLSLPTALLFGGIMVVTGPTVIGPLLRQAKLSSRPATLLRWEGIVNDPIGALLAVVVFEAYHLSQPGAGALTPFEIGGSLILGSVIASVWGVLLGLFVARAFRLGWVPEFLKTPVLLALVILCFSAANGLQEEAGLLAVTAMGITIANSKLPSINQIRLFKENIAVLFVSGVFILLTANLTPEVLLNVGWRDAFFVAAMLLLVRPITVLTSMFGTKVTMQERFLVGWIAPRGIVAVAVSGLFAEKMVGLGYEDGARMVPLAFAMVFATVVAHGFSIAPLARWLGLAASGRPGVLIVGGSPWSAALGAKLKDMKIPVLITDANYRALRPARNLGVETFYGEVLSEVTEHHIEFVRYGTLLALTGNDSHNALVCTDLAHEINRTKTFQLTPRTGSGEGRRSVSYALQGRPLFAEPISLDDLLRRHYGGWDFQMTRITEEYTPEDFAQAIGDDGLLVMLERDEQCHFSSSDQPLKPKAGDRVLAYVSPEALQRKPKKPKVQADQNSADPAADIEELKEEALEKVGGVTSLTGS
ncbi:MAG: sodium:proton antiporter [Pseudomonadota bacterium]